MQKGTLLWTMEMSGDDLLERSTSDGGRMRC